MKKLLLLLVLAATRLCAQSEVLDLGSHGKLTLYIEDGWTFNVADFGGQVMVTVQPKSESVNATCSLTVSYPEQDKFEAKRRLQMKVEVDGLPLAEQSKEGKAVAKEFSLRSGFGFYCNFTDPELVGKKPKKGDYKTITQGTIRLAPDVLIEVSISADGFTSAPYQQLLGMIEGMEFEAGGKKRGK